MAKYIGKRIVPVHCGRWNQSKTYEMLSIVLEETSGDSYISRRAVPSGTAITDTNYWMLHSLYSQQIKDMSDQMAATEQRIKADNDATEAAIKQDNQITREHVDQNLEQTTEVINNSGSELPSTGGIGTTMFYIVGSVLVIGAAVVLISKRRMAR